MISGSVDTKYKSKKCENTKACSFIDKYLMRFEQVTVAKLNCLIKLFNLNIIY